MIKRTYILLLLLLVNCLSIFAQRYRYDDFGEGRRGGHGKAPAVIADTTGSGNDCSAFFFENINKNNAVFKSVRAVTYISDSAMNMGKVSEQTKDTYNKKGQTLVEETRDNGKRVSDRTVNVYDDKFREIKTTEYDDDQLVGLIGLLAKSEEEEWAYDTKGDVLKDIDKDYNIEDGNSSTSVFSKYDTAGNQLEEMTIDDEGKDGKDTSYTYNRFDTKKNPLFTMYKGNGNTTKEYFRYNDKGMQTFNASVTSYDSTVTYTDYDKKGDVSEMNKYNNGRIVESYHRKVDEKGNATEMDEEISVTDAESCANNTVIVTVTDSSGNTLSIVKNTMRNNKPFTSTTIHKYERENGRITLDSSITTGEGPYYSMTSVQIQRFGFDKNGNMTASSKEGSEEFGYYSSSYKWTKVYNDQSNPIDEKDYSSCDSDKITEETIYTYYGDDKSIKQQIVLRPYSKIITDYAEDGRMLRSFTIPVYPAGDSGNDRYYGRNNKRDYELVVYYYEPLK